MKYTQQDLDNAEVKGFEKGQSFRFSKIILYISSGMLGGLILGYFIN